MPPKAVGVEKDTIQIDPRPGVSSLALYAHLNYDPWYALGEFVDNALQSYLFNQDWLKKNALGNFGLEIRIDVSDGGRRIEILDNAAGISTADVVRAFSPASPPPIRTGLSEFGIGMKSAGIFFTNNWRVETSAIGEPFCREVVWDVDDIVNNQRESIPIYKRFENPTSHYTRVILENLRQPIQKRTVSKIKVYLAEIYRLFIQKKDIAIYYNGELLVHKESPSLVAPPTTDLKAEPIVWEREISFSFGEGLSAKGRVRLLETMSSKENGFSLFRRGRIIVGLGDEKYRPQSLLGAATTMVNRRISGDIEIDGLPVAHQKNGFLWGQHEGAFLDSLKEALKAAPFDFMRQAKDHRSSTAVGHGKTGNSPRPGVLTGLGASIGRTQTKSISPVTKIGYPEASPNVFATGQAERFRLETSNGTFEGELSISHRLPEDQWLEVHNIRASKSRPDIIEMKIELSSKHPLIAASLDEPACATLLRKFAISFAIAECRSRQEGAPAHGRIGRILNEMLGKSHLESY